jgi:hypothetical protein
MRFRKLRIAWSLLWGVAALLIVILWARSYRSMDQLGGPLSKTRIILIGSINGHLLVQWPFHDWGYRWNVRSTLLNSADRPSSPFDMEFRRLPDGFAMSQWFLAVMAVTIGSLPWLCFRFSLRTLLMATTLLALLLGLIVYINR